MSMHQHVSGVFLVDYSKMLSYYREWSSDMIASRTPIRGRNSCLLMFVVLALSSVSEAHADDESQCALCHISGRTLRQITREIAAELGDAVTESPLTVGEG